LSVVRGLADAERVMLSPSRLAVLIVAMLSVTAGVAPADEVVFKDGDRVSGTVTRVGDGKITIETARFGTVSADLKDVKSFTAKNGVAQATPPATATTKVAATKPTTVAAAPAPPASPPPLPAKTDKVKRWSGSVTVTGLATRGNSDSESLRVAFDAVRKGDNNTLTLGAGYAFGQTQDRNTGVETTTTDSWFAQGKVDHSLNEKLYDYALLRLEADYVADLDLRASPGVGLGYRWINKPDAHFNTEVGVTWVYEMYNNDGSNEHTAIRFAYHFDKKLNDKVSLVHNVEYLPNVADPGDFNLNADAGIRAMLTQSMFAEFKAEWRRDSTPAPGAEKDDLRYTVGVGWKF
jgi:putative salt-induced outer membrane protein YdiY